jgi:poly-gamma-glutamate capsule biosynthesis protein CapA/YwtB (metallophosphatase superfamily)
MDSMLLPASPADLPPIDSKARPVRLGFAGDLMQHEQQTHDDFHRSYSRIAPYLRSFELMIGNLEFPVDSSIPAGPDPGTLRFNGSTSHLDAIADAGFDILQTANNHCFDRGLAGMLRTLDAVEGRGIRAVGTARSLDSLRAGPLLVRVNGVTIAFRAYTRILNVQVAGAEPGPRRRPVPGPRGRGPSGGGGLSGCIGALGEGVLRSTHRVAMRYSARHDRRRV